MKLKLFLMAVCLSVATITQAAFINDKAPAFSLKSLNGPDASLKDFEGKVVFVNFWASWCPPCKQEFPEINELANEYKGQNVQVVAINLDKSPDRVQKFLSKIQITPSELKILLDPDQKVVADYVARSMPTSFIVDGTGVIRFVHFGFNEKDPMKWREEINSLMTVSKKK